MIHMIFTSRSVKMINKFVAKHTRECQIRPCTEIYEKLLKITKGNKDYIHINLSTLYLACGEFEKMEKSLDCISKNFKKDTPGVSMACYFYNNRAFGDLIKGNLEEAEQNLQTMKQYLELPNGERFQRGAALYESKQYLLSVLKGDCGEIELDLREKLVDQVDPSGKLLYGYILCTYLLNRGEAEKAVTYLTPMAEEGGDTFYAAWAREKLQNM